MLDRMTDNAARHAAGPRPTSEPRRQRQKARGQSLVEFALILPLFVTIFALSADFGRALTAYITVTGAAREGAAYGAQTMAMATNTQAIKDAAKADAGLIWGEPLTDSNVTVEGPDVCVDPYATVANPYSCVRVTVNYTFTPILPFPPIPNEVSMTRTVQMRVVN